MVILPEYLQGQQKRIEAELLHFGAFVEWAKSEQNSSKWKPSW